MSIPGMFRPQVALIAQTPLQGADCVQAEDSEWGYLLCSIRSISSGSIEGRAVWLE